MNVIEFFANICTTLWYHN